MRLLSSLVLACSLIGLALPAASQTLRIGLNSDPDALDPTVSRTVAGRQVFAAMCDKLIDIDAGLALVPQLAATWRWEDADRTLVLGLRPGVRFHDGSPMDGDAVAASLNRHLTMAGSTRKAEMGPVERIEVSGPLEVRIHLVRPFAPLLVALTDRAGMVVSKAAAALGVDAFAAKPVCAGPFQFVRRVPQDRIELQRFPDYWNVGAIHFDRVTYLPIPDATVRAVSLRSSSLDLIEQVQPTDLAALKADPKLRVITSRSLASYYIAVNVANGARANTPLGRNALLREALEASIDRKVLTDVAFDGLYVPGNQSVPPGAPFYVDAFPVPGRDLARARALLKQAGLDKVSMQMSVPNTSDYLQAAEVIQSMAAEAGIEIKLVITEVATLLKQWTDGDFESLVIQWSGRADVDANLYNFNACGMALNGGRYCNKAVDAALDAARGTTDLSRRMAGYAEANRILLADRPYIYLWHPTLVYGATAKLDGFKPVPDSLIRLTGVRLLP